VELSLANMALPFCLLAFASLSLSAGFTPILNATVPFFAAIIGYLVYSQQLSLLSIAGLFIGFGGVVILVFDPASTTPALGSQLDHRQVAKYVYTF
jgi:drug/metabolite transporter (DMT)-like permease